MALDELPGAFDLLKRGRHLGDIVIVGALVVKLLMARVCGDCRGAAAQDLSSVHGLEIVDLDGDVWRQPHAFGTGEVERITRRPDEEGVWSVVLGIERIDSACVTSTTIQTKVDHATTRAATSRDLPASLDDMAANSAATISSTNALISSETAMFAALMRC